MIISPLDWVDNCGAENHFSGQVKGSSRKCERTGLIVGKDVVWIRYVFSQKRWEAWSSLPEPGVGHIGYYPTLDLAKAAAEAHWSTWLKEVLA